MPLLRRAQYPSLQAAVRRGAVAPDLAKAAGSGPVQGFLLLAGEQALAAAVRSAPGGAGRSAAVLRATAAAYDLQKDRVLRRVRGSPSFATPPACRSCS